MVIFLPVRTVEKCMGKSTLDMAILNQLQVEIDIWLSVLLKLQVSGLSEESRCVLLNNSMCFNFIW